MSHRLRVYQLIKSLNRGGAEVLLSEVIRATDPSRLEFAVGHFIQSQADLVPALEQSGVAVRCFDAPTAAAMLSAVPAVARDIRRFGADVVHCHLPLAGVVGRMAGALADVPVVYTEHNLADRYHPLTRMAAAATWRLQESVIAVSDEVRDSIGRFVHAAPARAVPVDVVRNAVHVESFRRDEHMRAAVRERCRIDASAVVVGTVAVFRSAKRLDRWLDVAELVVRAHASTAFMLVGYGPLEADVRRQISERRLTDHVILAGRQADVRPYLSAMDVYLMSSEREGLPIALLEAMAAGLPVVATSVGGIPEVVSEGTSGFLTHAEDVSGLARRTAQLVVDARRRFEMGAAGCAAVTQKFGIQRVVQAQEEIYRRACRGGRA